MAAQRLDVAAMRLLAGLILLPFRLLQGALWLARAVAAPLCAALGYLPVRFAGIALIAFAATQEPMPPGAFYGSVAGWCLFSYLARRLAPVLRPSRPARPKPPRKITPPAEQPPPARPAVSPIPDPPSRETGPSWPTPSHVTTAPPAIRRAAGGEAAMVARLPPALQQILHPPPGSSPA